MALWFGVIAGGTGTATKKVKKGFYNFQSLHSDSVFQISIKNCYK